MADRYVRVAVCAMGIFILVTRKRLGFSWRELPVGIVAGFALFSYVHLTVATLISLQTVLHRSTLTAINSAGYLAAASIWLVYALLSPKVMLGGSEGNPPPDPGQAPHLSLILE